MKRLAVMGGGVIGLSLAYEMSNQGWAITLLDTGEFGQQASWAGAGILPPSNGETAIHPLEHLEALSSDLHEQWARRLLEETGIDNEYRRCGALHVARSPGDRASLMGTQHHLTEHEIPFEQVDRQNAGWLEHLNPSLLIQNAKMIFVPDESQIRNPSHLAALIRGCEMRDVQMYSNVSATEFQADNDQVKQILFEHEGTNKTVSVDAVCVASGAWSGQLVERLGIPLPMVPVRGQIVLFKLDEQQFGPTTYEGARYIVSRSDGHVVVGATVEEVGFDTSTTDPELKELRRFAESVYPVLSEATFVKGWAGLRPATFDGFPYIGRLPKLGNAFVATGHFRSGLHLSTGTAVVIGDLINGKTARVDLTPFDPGRTTSLTTIDENQLDVQVR